MARIRSIKPEFWTDESIVECSRDARLLFIGIWTHSDDAGILEESVKQIKMKIFPGDFDINEESIRRMLDELSSNGLTESYKVGKRRYIKVLGWDKHQKIDRATYKYPLPNGIVPANKKDYSTSTRRALDEASPPERRGEERKGEEWRREEGSKKNPCPEPSPAKTSEPALVELPTNRQDEVFAVTREKADEFAKLYPAVNVEQELRGMYGWLMSNPIKRKTRSGMPRFITGWLAREQNKGPTSKPTSIAPGNRMSPAEQAIANREKRAHA